MILTALITVIGAYLLGSVSFAVIFSNLFAKKDVRGMGSGNAGATNVIRAVGFVPGLLTFLCDALKGFAACKLGELIFGYISENAPSEWAAPIYGAYICGVACMLGHILPLFFGFKGGKGVATSVGIFAVCCPKAIIIGLAVFAVMLLILRIVSLSSLTAAVTVVAFSVVFSDKGAALWPQAVMSIMMGCMVFVKHADNIKRLAAGEEKRIRLKR